MWDRANNKTVLRAGAGVFYDSAQGGFETLAAAPSLTNWFFSQPVLSGLSSGAQPDFAYSAPFAAVAAPGYTRPRTYEWNVTLEQSFGQQTFSAAYTGALGRRLLGIAQGGSDALDLDLGIAGNYFSSSYNALQLQFNRRVGKRVQALLSYTWSHSIDNLSDQTGQSLALSSTGLGAFGPATFLDPDQNRGDSDFDVRQSFHGALFITLPAPHSGRGAMLLRNWTASTIFFARTAFPSNLLTFTDTGYVLRPDLVPGQPIYLYGGGYPGGKSLNGSAFSTPPDGVVEGNLGRNAVRGLGAWQADLALHRDFRVTEHAAMQFRVEAFNVFNHPNFANPGDIGDVPQQADVHGLGGSEPAVISLGGGLSPRGTLGQLNQLFQIGGPRSLQLALRITF
jgi:hypothetical protein